MLPFIRAWAESAAGIDGETVFHGFSQIAAMRKAAVAATLPYDFVLSPTAPMTAYPAEMASPSGDPLNPFPHIGFTVVAQYVGAAGGDRSIAATATRACRSACKSSAAASTTWAC